MKYLRNITRATKPEKRPETMRNWEFKTDTYRNVALIRLRPSGGRAGENQSTKDMHEK